MLHTTFSGVPRFAGQMSRISSARFFMGTVAVYISIVAVMATIGSALTAGYLERRQVTKRFIP